MKIEKELKMIPVETSTVVATLYTRSTQSKAELRAASERALQAFLKSGGSIETVKARKAPKQKMSSKSSRAFCSGTGGFASGMPRKSTFSLS